MKKQGKLIENSKIFSSLNLDLDHFSFQVQKLCMKPVHYSNIMN